MMLFLSSVAIGQIKDQLAIYVPKENTSGVDENTKAYAIGEFTKLLRNNGMYIVVDRSAEYRELLKKEIGYQESGFVDDNELARLGHESGVKYICEVIFRKVFEEINIEVRLVDIEKGYVKVSDNRVIQKLTKETLNNEIQIMAEVIVGALGSNGINMRSANEKLVFGGGHTIYGYEDGHFVTLSNTTVKERLTRNPEALKLFLDGREKYDNNERANVGLIFGGVLMAIGLPLVLVDDVTRKIGAFPTAVGGVVLISSLSIPLVRKSVGSRKISKAVDLYNADIVR